MFFLARVSNLFVLWWLKNIGILCKIVFKRRGVWECCLQYMWSHCYPWRLMFGTPISCSADVQENKTMGGILWFSGDLFRSFQQTSGKGSVISLSFPKRKNCKLLGAPHNLQEFYGHTNLNLGNDGRVSLLNETSCPDSKKTHGTSQPKRKTIWLFSD